MGLMPAPAPAVILGIMEFQRHDCVAKRMEYRLAVVGSLFGAKLTEILVSAVVVPDLTC